MHGLTVRRRRPAWPRWRLLAWLALLGVGLVVVAVRLVEPGAAPRDFRAPDSRLAVMLPTPTPAPLPTATRARPTSQLPTSAVAVAAAASPLAAQPSLTATASPLSRPAASPTPTRLPLLLPPRLQPPAWEHSFDTVRAEAVAIVARQLAAYPSLAGYAARAERAAGRARFLAPLEFLIWVSHDRRPAQRDALLALYQRDPAVAYRQAVESGLWPSGRSELIVESRAQFDADDDRVLINRGANDDDEVVGVLVHELWHALPVIRNWQGPDGTRYLTSGFWTERLDPASGSWMPDDDPRGLVFAPYLIDEALAYRLEWQALGKQPETHAEVRRAAEFLERVEALLGSERLLELYLASDPDGFYQALQQHRQALREYFL